MKRTVIRLKGIQRGCGAESTLPVTDEDHLRATLIKYGRLR